MHRINVIGTPLHKAGKTIYRPSTNKGMADIHATIVVGNIPVSVWFEVKTKKGRLSPNQKAFQESVEAAGGYYYVVRSIDEFDDAYEEVCLKTMQNIKDYVPF